MGYEEKDKTYQIPISLNNRSEIPVIMVSFEKKRKEAHYSPFPLLFLGVNIFFPPIGR